MSDLDEMIRQYTIKCDRKIKNICAPLKECLGISVFRYICIDQDGRYAHLSNHPESMKFYYAQQFYKESPFLLHPHLFRSGYLLIPQVFDTRNMKAWRDSFQVLHTFCITQHQGDRVEHFFFELTNKDTADKGIFFNYIDLLNKFIQHFKKEAKLILSNIYSDSFNIKEVKGSDFIKQNSLMPLMNQNPNVQRFLKLILPLSYREHQCFDLFKKGNSAQSTAAILKISQRTVEGYFDNIKNKLGCSSKAELLEW